MSRPILVAGPTASGKSELALMLAEKFGGAVVNADSQQAYRDWRILTARPGPEDEARVPHFLYGHVSLAAEYSVGTWLAEVEGVLDACRARGLRPIITGGTGLYFKVLTEGLAPIPQIPPEIRAEAEECLERMGLAAFADALEARDGETMVTIDRANPMRLLRAWEVLEATGTGLAEWRRRTPPPLLPLRNCAALVLDPPREWLIARCDARFDAMIQAGVMDEVRRVRDLGLDIDLPGMKALGAPELLAHLDGALGLNEAVARAKIATRRYAKRQTTWVRNQMFQWTLLSGHDPAENLDIATDLVTKPG